MLILFGFILMVTVVSTVVIVGSPFSGLLITQVSLLILSLLGNYVTHPPGRAMTDKYIEPYCDEQDRPEAHDHVPSAQLGQAQIVQQKNHP